MQSHLHPTLLLLFLIVCMPSCRPGEPEGVLSQSEMEEVLYDYHMAQALAQQENVDSFAYYVRLYTSAALAKHHTTTEAFDRSMEWYERHTDKLEKIYKNLEERMSDGTSAPSYTFASGTSATTGDTINIWHNKTSVLLNSQSYNHATFTERPDTSIQCGDELQWRMNTSWFYHDGERAAVAQIIVYYQNDSVAVSQMRIFTSDEQYVRIKIGSRPIERIECTLYQSTVWTPRPRILYIKGMSLYRIRRHETEQPDDARLVRPDSLPQLPISNEKRIRDSLLRQDTLDRRRSHFD